MLKQGQSQANGDQLVTLELRGAQEKLTVGPQAPPNILSQPPAIKYTSFLKFPLGTDI